MIQENINTPQYWDDRFHSGHWESVGGREQTRQFANAQLRHIGLPSSFSGVLLDFGCGLGDAFPVYRNTFPNATLLGVDVSEAAIAACRQHYGKLADFCVGDHNDLPPVDVIVTSNVLEHLANPVEVASALRSRCKALYVVVPFQEWPRIEEHIHTFDLNSFRDVGPCETRVFASHGWSQYGWKPLWVNIRIKNLIRPLIGRQKVQRRLQIIYRFGVVSQ